MLACGNMFNPLYFELYSSKILYWVVAPTLIDPCFKLLYSYDISLSWGLGTVDGKDQVNNVKIHEFNSLEFAMSILDVKILYFIHPEYFRPQINHLF